MTAISPAAGVREEELILDAIRIDGGTQTRAEIDMFTVDEYAQEMDAGAIFPPVDVFFDGVTHWLSRGFHRYHARRKTGKGRIACVVHTGTQADARRFAIGSNNSHGKRRTPADKRREIEMALKEKPGTPDREIARWVGVDHVTVGKVRLSLSGDFHQIAGAPRTVTRNGVTYPMDVSGIGKKTEEVERPAPNLFPDREDGWGEKIREAKGILDRGAHSPPEPAVPILHKSDGTVEIWHGEEAEPDCWDEDDSEDEGDEEYVQYVPVSDLPEHIGEARAAEVFAEEPLPERPLVTPLPVLAKPKKYITLPEWKELHPDLQIEGGSIEEMRDGSKSQFNNQGDNENIEWALWSWNPVTGCEHNCPYCYARDIAERFYVQKFEPSIWPERLAAPRNTRLPAEKIAQLKASGNQQDGVRAMGLQNVFTCSMADLFGRWVPRRWIDAVLEEVRSSPQWNFLFLTKFPQRMAEFEFPENAWVGTTVDCQARVANAERAFAKIKAGVKWLSCEPLIEPLTFQDLGVFDWVVIGGSSRSTQTPEWVPPDEWVTALKHEAYRLGVKVYEKSNIRTDRARQYPGIANTEAEQAPEQLRYLPSSFNSLPEDRSEPVSV